MQQKKYIWPLIAMLLFSFLSACASEPTTGNSGTGAIQVVAAENFYGDIVKQVGGDHVVVTSILSDPAIDPHAYEGNVQNAMAVGNAQLVVKNGGGYDSWMDNILSASPKDDRVVIDVFTMAPFKLPDNEHVWYGIENSRALASTIAAELKKIDSAHTATYESNLQKFEQSLKQVEQKMTDIKSKYADTPVGLTETIFLYQSEPLGLKVLTPPEFQEAIAEGNDPPADTVATANKQVNEREIKVLIYNEQKQTALTENLKKAAQQSNIPLIPITETLPANKTYQQWMLDQLTQLEQGLSRS